MKVRDEIRNILETDKSESWKVAACLAKMSLIVDSLLLQESNENLGSIFLQAQNIARKTRKRGGGK